MITLATMEPITYTLGYGTAQARYWRREKKILDGMAQQLRDLIGGKIPKE